MEEQTRKVGRVRLRADQLDYLIHLLIEDRDQFFEDKRYVEARNESSFETLREIRTLEKILRAVEGARWDRVAREGEPGEYVCPTCKGDGYVWVAGNVAR